MDQIRRVQAYNYELGLQDMEKLLDPAIRRNIPRSNPGDAYSMSVAKVYKRTQDRLDKIYPAVDAKKSSLEADKKRVNAIFFGLYALGSIAIVAASLASLRRSRLSTQ